MDCVADLFSHTISECASDEKWAEVHHRDLVNDPLSPVATFEFNPSRRNGLVDCQWFSEKNLRNYKVVSRKPYASSAGFYAPVIL